MSIPEQNTAATELLTSRLPSPPPGAAAAPSQNATLTRNVVWNWMGVAVEATVGLLLAPLLINRLGDTTYGLWILIGSLTSYFGLLDFGLRISVGRFLAFYQGRHDRDGVRATLSTALAILTGMGVVVFVGIAGMASLLPNIVDIPPELVAPARWSLAIVGLHLACWFVLRLFDAALWSAQRFDLLNAIDIPTALLRAGLTITLVTPQTGLLTLAWITLGTTLMSGGVKAICSFRVVEGLGVSLSHVRRANASELFGFGLWNFLSSLAHLAKSQLSPVLVAMTLGVSAVTPFSIVMRLVVWAGTFLSAAAGVFVPLAASLHARKEAGQIRKLVISGTQFTTAIALWFTWLCVFLGKPFLHVWIGARYESVWCLWLILCCGEVLPMSATAGQSFVLGTARHRFIAGLSLVECALAAVLMLTLSPSLGLLGACLAFAVAAGLVRGVFMMRYILKTFDLRWTDYFVRCLLPVLLATCVPVTLLGMGVAWHSPTGWGSLTAYGAAFSIAYVLLVAFIVAGPDQLLMYYVGIRNKRGLATTNDVKSQQSQARHTNWVRRAMRDWLRYGRTPLRLSARDADVLFVPVLGMPRSGTSCVTQILMHNGLHLGDDLLEPNEGNPDGYWEAREAVEINDSFLRRFSAGIANPPEGAVRFPGRLFHRADWFLSDLARRPTVGWKDPRTTLTWPAWLELLHQRRYRVVACFRHPLEVCASIQRMRKDLSHADTLSLWLDYNRRLLAIGDDVLWVNFSASLTDQLPMVCAELGLSFNLATVEVFKESLRHHRSQRDDSSGNLLADRVYDCLLETWRAQQERLAIMHAGEPEVEPPTHSPAKSIVTLLSPHPEIASAVAFTNSAVVEAR